jgi:hypothetical protein
VCVCVCVFAVVGEEGSNEWVQSVERHENFPSQCVNGGSVSQSVYIRYQAFLHFILVAGERMQSKMMKYSIT